MDITVKQAAKMLLGADDILIVCHKSPDGDTLGSAYALYYALKGMGKRVNVDCSDPISERFSYFTSDYVEDSFEPKFFVAVDIAAVQLLGDKLAHLADKFDLCIDHHPSNEHYAEETCLYAAAAATCEIIYDVLVALKATITPIIANCIYTGISTDTGCFRFSSTTKRSHIIASELFDFGAEHEFINRVMFETKSRSRVLVEQIALSSIEYYFDGRVALISITQDMIDKSNADESELDGISSIPRTIEGVRVGITMREKAEGGYKFSIRTTSKVDASALCSIFGGGGHKRAAGCFIDKDYDTAKKLIIDAVKSMI